MAFPTSGYAVHVPCAIVDAGSYDDVDCGRGSSPDCTSTTRSSSSFQSGLQAGVDDTLQGSPTQVGDAVQLIEGCDAADCSADVEDSAGASEWWSPESIAGAPKRRNYRITESASSHTASPSAVLV